MADSYLNTRVVVDDEKSNLQVYRVAIIGRTTDDQLFIQVINIDLVKSKLSEGRANLSDLNQKCVSDIQLRQEMIVIRCDEDHTLSIM